MSNIDLTNKEKRIMNIDTGLPFLYIPEADYESFLINLGYENRNTGINCNFNQRHCKYMVSCDAVMSG
jgi:hypothetical protein